MGILQRSSSGRSYRQNVESDPTGATGYGISPILNIQVDEAQLREVESLLRNFKDGAAKVMQSAINRTLDETRTFVGRQIRQRVKIPKRLIDRRLIVHKSGPNLSGTLQIQYSKRLSLGDFNPRQTKRGVSYALAAGGRKTIPGAFLRVLPLSKQAEDGSTTYNQVFKRADGWSHREPKHRRGHRRKGLSGLPVISLKGVSAWGVFTKAGLQRPTEQEASRLLAKNIENRLDRTLFTRTGSGLATIRAGGEV